MRDTKPIRPDTVADIGRPKPAHPKCILGAMQW